jgi:uncharacterized Tic20 family protein
MSSMPPTMTPAPMQTMAPSSDDKTMAMIAHLGGIIGFIPPLIIWLIKKDQSPFVNDQGREALNFQITMLIGWMVCIVTSFLFIGFFLIPVLMVANLVFCILGGLAAQRGEAYRYPVTLRLIN